MKYFLWTALVLSTLFSNIANAGGSVGKAKINGLAFQNSHLMIYSASWENPNDCQKSSGVLLDQSDPNFERAYALILAAYMSGKEISAYSDGCKLFDDRTYNKIRGYKYLVVHQ